VTPMQFGLHGPLTVTSGDSVLVPAGKQRVVLPALLLNANHQWVDVDAASIADVTPAQP
jgi:hypothetical protein